MADVNSWRSLPLQDLEPQDCDLTANWAAKFLSTDDPPLLLTRNYLLSAVPENWTDIPRHGELMAWFTDKPSGEVKLFITKTLDHAVSYCKDKFCQHLGWEGDPDVFGIGVIISYHTVAALSLLWFIAINVGDLPHMKGISRGAKENTASRLLRGFQESASDFLDATLVFSAAMQIAAITRYAPLFYDPKADFSFYGLIGSIFMSTFTIFPCIVLQTVTDRMRRQWLRIFLWLVVIISSITLKVLSDQLNLLDILDRAKSDSHTVKEVVWAASCGDEERLRRLDGVGTLMHVWLALNLCWWLWYVGVSIVPQRWKDKHKTHRRYHLFKKAQRVLLLLDGSASIVIMYTCIGHFHGYNNHVRAVAGLDGDGKPARSEDADHSWTFGQVLALATWIPVIIQLLSIIFYGKEGMSAKFSWRYEVVERENGDQSGKDAPMGSTP
ncbi:hypothetical protein B0I35DRAFT_155735 [Stachybotrys elegans]|uniref:Uncharacterized protein n=1 Tax=Stachybotrys elegans TaxID=80388 RepID=A0A8K0WKC1_9HYPO|nr:hypothetical protein B0I35DRAFT_155735 [Stachybotrys elegans]